MHHTKTSSAIFRGASLALALSLAFAIGCKKTAQPAPEQAIVAPDDNSLTSSIQSRISGDSALSSEPIQVSVQNGVVSLNGTVSNAAARSLASSDAGQVPGVKTVLNNLTVQAAPPIVASVPAPASHVAPPAPKKLPLPPPAPIVRNPPPPPVANNTPLPPPPVQQPSAPPPPPAPVVKTVTLEAGSAIPVRITQTLDSATTQTGDSFTGTVATDIVVRGMVALRQGTPVSGRVVDAKDATHFTGSSRLSIELTSISRRGERIAVSTQPFAKEGAARGKNTAVKTGVGAAAGAILGGIFGGGKGAAIGAAAGGGTGAGINAVTKGQQVQIPSESTISFVLANSVAITTSQEAGTGTPTALQPR